MELYACYRKLGWCSEGIKKTNLKAGRDEKTGGQVLVRLYKIGTCRDCIREGEKKLIGQKLSKT